jgi:multidrug transporter EmrE-like cation transporter
MLDVECFSTRGVQVTLGYLLLFTSILAFGMLGIFHKVADHPECRPKMTALLLHFWGGVLAVIYTVSFDARGLEIPKSVLVIGSCTGLVASLTLFVFQTALKYGKISTSWLIINMTAVVPVLISLFVFNENLNSKKTMAIVLVFAAMVMLWLDKRADLKKADVERSASNRTIKSKWLPLMIVTFIGQGLASSSQKVLVEAGVADYVWQFLIVFYWSGFFVILTLSLLREAWPNRREIVTALIMAGCSVIGNCAMTMALKTVKGSVAYPASNGSLIMVVMAGVLFFREKIHPIGIAGIICGIGAILILIKA